MFAKFANYTQIQGLLFSVYVYRFIIGDKLLEFTSSCFNICLDKIFYNFILFPPPIKNLLQVSPLVMRIHAKTVEY